jgi:hypothetical protein
MTAIAPSLKTFMDKALPKGEGKHVLALGEDHRQVAHVKWLEGHLDKLQKEHSLGAIGFESPPFMEVFLWAYKDGKLPVGNDPEKAKAYVERIFTLLDPVFKESTKARISLALSALDKGIPVTFFDSRDVLNEGITSNHRLIDNIENALSVEGEGASSNLREGDVQVLARLARQDQAELEVLRVYTKEDNRSKIRDDCLLKTKGKYQIAFMLMEAQKLLKDNPEYQTRLDNIEAVIKARQDWQGHGKQAGYDATSAAIIQAALPKGENAFILSGGTHMLGLGDKHQHERSPAEGTFAQHLDMLNLKASTAIMGTNTELTEFFLNSLGGLSLYRDLQSRDHPYHLPAILATDTGELVPPAQEITQQPDAKTAPLAARVYENKQYYNEANPGLADAPFPSEENKREVKVSQAALKKAYMQTPLQNLADNKPWADMIARQAREVQGEEGKC